MAKSMYDIIKKQNGERFAKAIRNYDNGIFDIPDIDKIVKYAGREAEPLMNYLISLKNVQIEEHAVYMDPIELLKTAGYDAYVADTLEKQNAISKYYKDDEKLCTFRDDKRYEKYYIINAVRKDVDKIKREDFTNPQRDDKYGTSVLSIQILKQGGFISIKNRYNHTVRNCDNTLNSNPDNIISGLSCALKHYFNTDFSARCEPVPIQCTIVNNQIFNYVSERNNVYISENAYVKDGQIYDINKNSEIMLGKGLMLDITKKEVIDLTVDKDTQPEQEYDLFRQSLNDAIKDKKLQIKKNPLGGYDIFANDQQILTLENTKIVNINIPNAEYVYLPGAENLRGEMDLHNVKHLDIHGANFSQGTKLILPKNADYLDLIKTTLPPGDYDLSNVKRLWLSQTDFSHATKLILPNNMNSVSMIGVKFPAGVYTFSNVKKLILNYSVFSPDAKLILPRDADRIDLKNTTLPAGDCDLSGVKELDLTDADMTKVNNIILPKKMNTLHLGRAKLPAGSINFNETQNVYMDRADLSLATNLTFSKNMIELGLSHTTLPAGVYDFSNLTYLNLEDADLSKVTKLTLPKNAQKLYLSNTKLPSGEYDLSDVEELDLSYADLSKTTRITLPKNAQKLNLFGTILPPGEYDLSNTTDLKVRDTDFSQATKLILPPGFSDDTVKTPVSYTMNKLKFNAKQKLNELKNATNKLKNKIKQRINEYVQNTDDTVNR